MIFTDEKIEATHEEMIGWLDWYVANKIKGGKMEKEFGMKVGNLIAEFLVTAPGFMAFQTKKVDMKCTKCHGRGHNNLYAMKSNVPMPCDYCSGTGYEPPAVPGIQVEEYP